MKYGNCHMLMRKPCFARSEIIFAGSGNRDLANLKSHCQSVSNQPVSRWITSAGMWCSRSFLRHVADLLLAVVGDAAHPQTKRPERRHGAAAGHARVLFEHLLRRAEEHEQIELFVAGVDHVRLVEVLAEVERRGRAGVDEHAVAAAARGRTGSACTSAGSGRPSRRGRRARSSGRACRAA